MYDEKNKLATYCGSSAVDPPKDDNGDPWPCHNVPPSVKLDIVSVQIPGKFKNLHCSRENATAFSVAYEELEPAIRGMS